MDSLEICIQQFEHLSTAKVLGREAPHKAVLLLAIMDLVDNGMISTPKIQLTKELETAFAREWRLYVGSPLVFKCKIATPFWHMNNEPFYELYLNSGKGIKNFSNPYSVKRLREETFALIDDDLFSLMKDKESSIIMRKVLINKYLIGLRSDLSIQAITLLSSFSLVCNIAS